MGIAGTAPWPRLWRSFTHDVILKQRKSAFTTCSKLFIALENWHRPKESKCRLLLLLNLLFTLCSLPNVYKISPSIFQYLIVYILTVQYWQGVNPLLHGWTMRYWYQYCTVGKSFWSDWKMNVLNFGLCDIDFLTFYILFERALRWNKLHFKFNNFMIIQLVQCKRK